jgi:hypothetical protein
LQFEIYNYQFAIKNMYAKRAQLSSKIPYSLSPIPYVLVLLDKPWGSKSQPGMVTACWQRQHFIDRRPLKDFFTFIAQRQP